MGVLDKIVSAVTPEAGPEERAQARAKALALAGNGGSHWLSMTVEHHRQIEAAFDSVKAAAGAAARRAAQKELALVLTGHSLAEETVLYPAMALSDQKAHSGVAFTEQSAAKVQLAALDDLEPVSQNYLDKLEHLRAAVAHHIHEEESNWFVKLHDTVSSEKQTQLTQRYQEEFERYTGGDGAVQRAV